MLFRRLELNALPSARTRTLLLASIAALIVTSFDAHAAPAAPSSAATGQQLAPADATEFGARKRGRARRGNAAAGAAMMGMMIGTVGAAIAAQQRREAYDRGYYERGYARRAYGYRYGPQPYGYGPQPYGYYQPRVYRNPNTTNYGPPRIGW